MKKSEKPAEDTSFQDSIDRLESLVNELEAGDLSLEDSLKTFEAGIQLLRKSQRELEQAEQSVRVLLEENGEPNAQALEEDAEDQ